MAKLYEAKGDTNTARQKAELVWNHAEEDSELGSAAALLGRTFSTNLVDGEIPSNGCVLALVRCEGAESWLMNDLREELPRFLEIPVVFRSTSFPLPKPRRDPLHMRADELRERIRQARKDPRFQTFYESLKLSSDALERDEDVFRVVEAALRSDKNTQEQARLQRDETAFLRRLGPQWEAGELVRILSVKMNATAGSRVGYLGVTRVDLFSNESRYVFGVAATGANCGIFSYIRYTSAVAEEPPNRDRLKERAVKQALSSIGLMFGIPRCTDPTCARAYANSLPEHDAKEMKLCTVCKGGFQKRFSVEQ